MIKKSLSMPFGLSTSEIQRSMENYAALELCATTRFDVDGGEQVAHLYIETIGRRQQWGTDFFMPITGKIFSSPWGDEHRGKPFTGRLNINRKSVSIEFAE